MERIKFIKIAYSFRIFFSPSENLMNLNPKGSYKFTDIPDWNSNAVAGMLMSIFADDYPLWKAGLISQEQIVLLLMAGI